MSDATDPADQLWKEYSALFERFDDYSLARWMVQTLGNFSGALWRYSHPLVGAYKLAAQVANQRQLWLKRLVDIPVPFEMSACCRSPVFPFATRDIIESGLICLHCNETVVPLKELNAELREPIRRWAKRYGKVHGVAHYSEEERERCGSYDLELEDAAQSASELLRQAGESVFPPLLEVFATVVWEDHDECLGVRPEDTAY